MSEPMEWSDMLNNRFFVYTGDKDDIRVTVEDSGDDSLTCCLQSSGGVTWWKGIQFLTANGGVAAVAATQDQDRGPHCISVRVVGSNTYKGFTLELLKGKGFNVHTGMYSIAVKDLNGGDIVGKRIMFDWHHD